MRTSTILSMFTAAAIGAAAAAAASATTNRNASGSALAEVFYACPSGYAFAQNGGDAAHCKKPAYTDQRVLGACPVGFPTYRVDRLDSKDMCSGTNPVTGEVLVEPGCKVEDLTAGYTKRIVASRDYCGKLMPQQIQPPNRAVSR
jgi:hypothetical protein